MSVLYIRGKDGSFIPVPTVVAEQAVDSELSTASTNPVQNKAIAEAVNRLSEEIGFKAEAYGLPMLYLNGDISIMDKGVEVTLDYVYGERNGTCTCKWQGNSSLTWPKKNYTIKFDNAFEVVDGWGAQKKYCFKANFIDSIHARNVVTAKLWGEIVKSREPANSWLNALNNGGAIDGFPCIIMLNGKFHGLYTWNIPKDGWMFGMGEGEREAILCADYHVDATRFKGLANLTDDYELEYVSDKDNAAWVLESLNRCIGAVIDADAFTLDTTVAQYLDWESAIDYYILLALVGGTDMISKNFILATKDGVKWHFSAYDMDTIYGLEWDGKTFHAPTGYATIANISAQHRVFDLIKNYKTDAFKARYKALRSGVMSEANLFNRFVNFVADIPAAVFNEDQRLWPTIPSTSANTVQALLEWYRQRVIAIDAEVEALKGTESSEIKWVKPSGSPAAVGTVDETTIPGAYISVDKDYSSNKLYIDELHANTGATYKFGAKYTAQTEGLNCRKVKLVQILDTDGNILTEGLTGQAYGVAMTYIDAFKGYSSNGDYCTFTLAESVASFRLGFVWSIEPATPGEKVIISDVYLETV